MPKFYLLLLVTSLYFFSINSFFFSQRQQSLSQLNNNADINITGLLKLKSIVRSIDGSYNNPQQPNWGKSQTSFLRKTYPRYEDGKGQPISNLPKARFISQSISKLQGNIVTPNSLNLTMLFGTWGQFLDHDVTLSDQRKDQPVSIPVPRCDRYFDLNCTGKRNITYYRSGFDPKQQVRTDINQITAWIDAGMVYGATEQRSNRVRSFKGGKLKISSGNLLPIDQQGNFYAGDIRATENMGLTSLQILFLREHNRLCDLIVDADSTLTDEEVYTTARNYVIGLIQKISFYDYLSNLFGRTAFNKYIGEYRGYNSSANPSISTQFSSTAFRIGHPYIPNSFKLVDNNNLTVSKLGMYELYVSNPKTLTYFTVNLILKGLAFTPAKQRDLEYVDQLRNVPPQIFGADFDLFAVNTERVRDHGIPDYNSLRVAWGLPKRTSFQQIFADREKRLIIQKSYNSVDNIDANVGVLGERTLEGSLYGELGAAIAGEQFSNIRNGDRFWFQYAYPSQVVREILGTTITDIILRNTQIKNMPINGFYCGNCTVN